MVCERGQQEAAVSSSRRELSQRSSAGLEVVLYWDGSDAVTVSVHDASTGEAFELEVVATDALDAFWHPYAYAAGCGVPYTRPAADPSYANA
jgi:hypothetical protein